MEGARCGRRGRELLLSQGQSDVHGKQGWEFFPLGGCDEAVATCGCRIPAISACPVLVRVCLKGLGPSDCAGVRARCVIVAAGLGRAEGLTGSAGCGGPGRVAFLFGCSDERIV